MFKANEVRQSFPEGAFGEPTEKETIAEAERLLEYQLPEPLFQKENALAFLSGRFYQSTRWGLCVLSSSSGGGGVGAASCSARKINSSACLGFNPNLAPRKAAISG